MRVIRWAGFKGAEGHSQAVVAALRRGEGISGSFAAVAGGYQRGDNRPTLGIVSYNWANVVVLDATGHAAAHPNSGAHRALGCRRSWLSGSRYGGLLWRVDARDFCWSIAVSDVRTQ
jgi:hypothetical protein